MNETTASDDYLWLEDIHGERAMDWVERHNAITTEAFFDADFRATSAAIREALDAEGNIPWVTKRGDYYYNFWRDADHPKGLWRRTTWESYQSPEPDWDVLIDLDALAQAEDTEWVWRGAQVRRSDRRRALISLSPDGGDAVTHREFDLDTRAFVDAADGGFTLPTAKGSASWLEDNVLLVSTVSGEDSMTTSTYPATVRVLKRGQELADAPEIARVPADHMMAASGVDLTPGYERALWLDILDFYNSVTWVRALDQVPAAQRSDAVADGWVKVDVPTHVNVSVERNIILFRPRRQWVLDSGDTVPAGALAVAELDAFLAGGAAGARPHIIFTPDAHTSLQGWSVTDSYVVLNLMRDVQSELQVLRLDDWTQVPAPAVPANHSVGISAVDPDDEAAADDFWMTRTGFLTPSTLVRGTLGAADSEVEIKAGPQLFDTAGLEVTQHFAVSADGTRVPYFQVAPKDLVLDGKNPVYQDGYGGFELSRTPGYMPTVGLGWLARSTSDTCTAGLPAGRRGVYVLANIRGGGEYGPDWHRAALRENRHRAYEDFAAVAQDLVQRGVTKPEYLACAGGSNGGLLVGNMLTQYPELFGAISCGVPLLDMRRYTKLSAGYSWIAEYGNPDTDDWEFIRTFSPYHLLDSAPKDAYPPVLFWTATSDDRVGPVQARKMAAKMLDRGLPGVWFYEDTAGGHSAAADNRQAAETRALIYRFLWQQLTGNQD